MSAPDLSLDEFKARLPIVELVGRHTRLKLRGRGDYWGCCPFHEEKSPSFHVVEDKGFYHCFGCGAHGNAIDFVMAVERVEFSEALERLEQLTGITAPRGRGPAAPRVDPSLYDANAAAGRWFARQLAGPGATAARAYLARRGIEPATAQAFGLGFAPDGRDALAPALAVEGFSGELLAQAGLVVPGEDGRAGFDRFRGRVMFPIADARGRIVGFGARALGDAKPKYLNSPETPLFEKGRLLYGLDRAMAAPRSAGNVIVAEGYMDVIALVRAGYARAVAPLGTAITEEQLRQLWRLADEPVVCLDGDAAGLRAAARAAARALPLLEPGKSLAFALLPTGEDPDSLLQRQGAGALAAILARTIPLSDFLWRHETLAGLPATPERRAALEARLRAHAAAIADPTVRAHYAQAFRERLEAAGLRRPFNPGRPAARTRGAKDQPRGREVRPPSRASLQLKARATIDARDDRDILAPVLRDPLLLGGHEDLFAGYPLATAEGDALRTEILVWMAQASDLDASDLLNHLTTYGFGDLVDQVLQAAPFVNGEQERRLNAGAAQRWRGHLLAYRAASARTDARQGASTGDAVAFGVLDRSLNDSRNGDGEHDSGSEDGARPAAGTA